MSEEVNDFLAHYGIRGMKWGKRKTKDQSSSDRDHKTLSPEQKAKLKKAAVIVGTAAAVTLLVAGSVYASKHMNKQMPKNIEVSPKAKSFVEAKMSDPVGVVHASRGKHKGFHFMEKGGMSDPLYEYDKAGFTGNTDREFFTRYGDRNEKVAARFSDPEGRTDHAGRIIPHEVILPSALAKDINSLSDAIGKVWPLIKDSYAESYAKSENRGY